MKGKDASNNHVNEKNQLEDDFEISYADLYLDPVDEYDADEDDFDDDDDNKDLGYRGGSRKGHQYRRDRFEPDTMQKIWKPSSRSNSKRW